MHGKRLVELGNAIGSLSKEIKLLSIDRDALDRSIERRKVAIIPDGGWPGKNAEERAAVAAKNMEDDADLIEMFLEKRKLDAKVTTMEADLVMLVEERRGLEFSVRDALARSLGGYHDDETDKVEIQKVDEKLVQAITGEKVPDVPGVYPIPMLDDVVIEKEDGSFELPPIPEGTPLTTIVAPPPEAGGLVRFDPEKQEYVQEQSFAPVNHGDLWDDPLPGKVTSSPAKDDDIVCPWDEPKDAAPVTDIEKPVLPAEAPKVAEIPNELPVSSETNVDQLLKELGF